MTAEQSPDFVRKKYLWTAFNTLGIIVIAWGVMMYKESQAEEPEWLAAIVMCSLATVLVPIFMFLKARKDLKFAATGVSVVGKIEEHSMLGKHGFKTITASYVYDGFSYTVRFDGRPNDHPLNSSVKLLVDPTNPAVVRPKDDVMRT